MYTEIDGKIIVPCVEEHSQGKRYPLQSTAHLKVDFDDRKALVCPPMVRPGTRAKEDNLHLDACKGLCHSVLRHTYLMFPTEKRAMDDDLHQDAHD